MEKKILTFSVNKKGFICLFVALLLFVPILAACSGPAGKGTAALFQDLNTADAFRLVQDNQSQADFVILDVRTQSEYSEGHIAGAILIDYYLRNFKDRLAGLDREKRYFVYCRLGNRSSQAASTMTALGSRRVFNLDAGIVDWTKAGYPLVK